MLAVPGGKLYLNHYSAHNGLKCDERKGNSNNAKAVVMVPDLVLYCVMRHCKGNFLIASLVIGKYLCS